MSGLSKNQKRSIRSGQRALIVEGEDDKSAFEALLARKFRTDWDSRWSICIAHGKGKVLEILADETAVECLGIVDRDEWQEDLIARRQQEVTNLYILPRYCLENYLIEPDIVWGLLSKDEQRQIAGGKNALMEAIVANAEQWVRHGVLWSVVNPLWQGLAEIGFKDDLLDFHHAQDDAFIRAKLAEWHGFIEPERLYQAFVQRLEAAQHEEFETKFHLYIHGKKFFEQHVNEVLRCLLKDDKTPDQRKREFFTVLSPPRDLEALWRRMGLV